MSADHFLKSIFSPEVFSVQELDLIFPKFRKVKFKKNELIKDKSQLIQNISLKQIATYLGITDTSLSRIRKQLASK